MSRYFERLGANIPGDVKSVPGSKLVCGGEDLSNKLSHLQKETREIGNTCEVPQTAFHDMY